MRDRSNPRFSPEAATLERRELLTSVVKLPFVGSDTMLNNKGVLVGSLPVKVGTIDSDSAFLLQPGPNAKPKPIPALPGDTTTQVSYLDDAGHLNDAGQVTGLSQPNVTGGPSRPARSFFYSPKSATVLIPALPGSDTVKVTLLSKGGLVAGDDDLESGPDSFSNSRGFLFSTHRGLVDLGTLPGLPYLLPTAINDQAGLVVGQASSGPGPTSSTPPIVHTFSYNIARRKLTDLGTAPGFDAFYTGFVDARGEIAGMAYHINPDGSSSGHVVTRGARTGWKDIGLMRGFDQITLINQMDDGRLLVEVSNSTTKATHAAIYQDGKGFRDIAALPASFRDPSGDGVQTAALGPPNKHGLAVVTTSTLQGGFRIHVLNLKTHALTDITSQISDPQALSSFNPIDPIAINDRNQFLVLLGVPELTVDSGNYIVSLDSKGTPVHINAQFPGPSNPLPPGVATATPIPVTSIAMPSPPPSKPVSRVP